MDYSPYVDTSRRSKVDPLASSSSNSPHVGPTSSSTHGCVDQMGALVSRTHLSEIIEELTFAPMHRHVSAITLT